MTFKHYRKEFSLNKIEFFIYRFLMIFGLLHLLDPVFKRFVVEYQDLPYIITVVISALFAGILLYSHWRDFKA